MNPKGYYVPAGYMGWTGKRYMLFPTVEEYYDYLNNT